MEIFLPVIIAIIYIIYDEYKYRKSDYFKCTHFSWKKVKFNKGRLGEYAIFLALKKVQNSRFLFNLYIPYDNGYTEIDCIMIHKSGLYVFESKNYSGYIFGNDTSFKWHQTLYSKYSGVVKESFYNPVMQNKMHIDSLMNLLGDRINNKLKYYNIVVFSNRCDFKNIVINNPDIKVVHNDELFNTVNILGNEDILNDVQIEWLYNKLYPYTQVTEGIRKNHIDNLSKFN